MDDTGPDQQDYRYNRHTGSAAGEADRYHDHDNYASAPDQADRHDNHYECAATRSDKRQDNHHDGYASAEMIVTQEASVFLGW